jgi:hypothetical protein
LYFSKTHFRFWKLNLNTAFFLVGMFDAIHVICTVPAAFTQESASCLFAGTSAASALLDGHGVFGSSTMAEQVVAGVMPLVPVSW